MRRANHAVRTVMEPLRITLELEPGADPIAGRLYAHDLEGRRFYGWLEFAAALDAACSEGSASLATGGDPRIPASGPWPRRGGGTQL